MGRLHAVALAALFLSACEGVEGNQPPPPAAGRVNAVMAKPNKAKRDAQSFCDKRHEADTAPPFAWPALSGGKAPKAKGWTWVNLWATWCEPCIEEMPMLQRWQQAVRSDGTDFDVTFLAVQSDAAALEKHAKKHPDTPPSLVLDPKTDLVTWMNSVGAGDATSVPIHLLVDPDSRLRCVRSGALKDKDLPAVRELLR